MESREVWRCESPRLSRISLAQRPSYKVRRPKVLDVPVCSVSDPNPGEEVCAWIVLKSGVAAEEEEIRAFCRDQITRFKVPCYVRFVSHMPTKVTGKGHKFVIRQMVIEDLGLTEGRRT